MVTTRAMASVGGVSNAEEEKKDEHGDYFIDKHDIHDSSLQRKKKNTTPKAKKSPFLLLLCATGITSCYLWYGTVQEHVFHLDNEEEEEEGEGTKKEKQSITLFLLATGTFSSFLLAWVWTIIGPIILVGNTKKKNELDNFNNEAEGAGEKKLNHALIVLTSFTYLSAMAASNESLHYVSYPTCVLAKSSKLIPTMIVGWLVDQWRSYSSRRSSSSSTQHHAKSINSMEWVGAALITIGILSFQYIQLNKQSNNDSTHDDGEKEIKGDSPYGLALLGLSLFCDGLMAGCQSTLKQKALQPNNAPSSVYYRPPTAMETMLYINLYATLILLPASHYVGQFQRGMNMIFATNSSTKSMLLLQLNLSASLGQVFIFLTIHHFSPLTCTTITTTRKFFTILLSVYKFGHVLDVWQWGSVGLVFGGLYLEIVAKLVEQQHQHGEDEDDGDANIGKKKKSE